MKGIFKTVRCHLPMWMCVFILFGAGDVLRAQDDVITIRNEKVFGKSRRPPVVFRHGLHMTALEQEGCGVCHHILDKSTGKLAYGEGEEQGCAECHAAQEKDGRIGLREAFHGSCVSCHRTLAREGQTNKGPATCGECHKRG